MDAPPDVPLKAEDIGETLTDDQVALLAQGFAVYANFIAIQYRKCRVAPSETETDDANETDSATRPSAAPTPSR